MLTVLLNWFINIGCVTFIFMKWEMNSLLYLSLFASAGVHQVSRKTCTYAALHILEQMTNRAKMQMTLETKIMKQFLILAKIFLRQ